ncbi:PstS family phosphate ABC transporter substrate-binding protein [Paralimibaculum aggregatum]|uniref:PstS family phosphate ABC transporter substrate-binding protein n=1 Tax=Paralimibaculum aggregatum TaxID=3036245 RepID=A0ABQ6LEI5_9RHOB|nr:substrate-binding domain-containing protein [Limibaculum sp. NKW23]GMG81751.1 PstS family phosphate ABC transporter substrate-binding protein [Limibaculum sp. NKW23]
MKKLSLAVAAAAIAVAGTAAARDQIKIVGSSTVFPFSTAVAEAFGKATSFPTPVVESTGSGGGLKLFCAGVGTEHPDVTNASRRIKASEFELCQENGVAEIIESTVGYDGIAVANAKGSAEFSLTREQLFKALVKGQGEPEMWNEIDPSLPAMKIEVLGPPPSSGTRDSWEELALQKGCLDAGNDKAFCKEIEIRDDGAWVDAGENDNLIVQKLVANPNAVGVFGFSFLEENADKVQGSSINGVEPTFDNILSGDYPIARTMYFYIKKAHVGVVPGIMEYAAEFVSEDASGEYGYLAEKGLIPLAADAHAANAEQVMSQATLTGEGL